MFISGIPDKSEWIARKFCEINGISQSAIIILFATLVLKRKWTDLIATKLEEEGEQIVSELSKIDEDQLKELRIRLDTSLVEDVKTGTIMDFVFFRYKLKPITKSMLAEYDNMMKEEQREKEAIHNENSS